MNNYLTRLVDRSLGLSAELQPLVGPRFGQGKEPVAESLVAAPSHRDESAPATDGHILSEGSRGHLIETIRSHRVEAETTTATNHREPKIKTNRSVRVTGEEIDSPVLVPAKSSKPPESASRSSDGTNSVTSEIEPLEPRESPHRATHSFESPSPNSRSGETEPPRTSRNSPGETIRSHRLEAETTTATIHREPKIESNRSGRATGEETDSPALIPVKPSNDPASTSQVRDGSISVSAPPQPLDRREGTHGVTRSFATEQDETARTVWMSAHPAERQTSRGIHSIGHLGEPGIENAIVQPSHAKQPTEILLPLGRPPTGHAEEIVSVGARPHHKDSESSPHIVRINIGRIEVRAVPSGSPLLRNSPRGEGVSPLGLSDYLKQHSKANRGGA